MTFDPGVVAIHELPLQVSRKGRKCRANSATPVSGNCGSDIPVAICGRDFPVPISRFGNLSHKFFIVGVSFVKPEKEGRDKSRPYKMVRCKTCPYILGLHRLPYVILLHCGEMFTI